MAAPGSIVLAKILCPQTEKVDDRLVKMGRSDCIPLYWMRWLPVRRRVYV